MFRRAFPSTISSSRTSRWARRGSHSPSGSRSLGTVAVASVDGDSTSVASWDFLTP